MYIPLNKINFIHETWKSLSKPATCSIITDYHQVLHWNIIIVNILLPNLCFIYNDQNVLEF